MCLEINNFEFITYMEVAINSWRNLPCFYFESSENKTLAGWTWKMWRKSPLWLNWRTGCKTGMHHGRFIETWTRQISGCIKYLLVLKVNKSHRSISYLFSVSGKQICPRCGMADCGSELLIVVTKSSVFAAKLVETLTTDIF